MLKVENIDVFNFEGTMRGMRNPKDSWNRNDTVEELIDMRILTEEELKNLVPSRVIDINKDKSFMKYITIGPNDLKLAQALIKGGSEHRKFLRQIFVSMDITAPLYWWKEFDTYKIATTANSCSTMHKILAYPINRDNFSLDNEYEMTEYEFKVLDRFMHMLEDLRQKGMSGDKNAWRLLIQLLPSSWNQKRTWTGNYENLRGMFHQRDNHKLTEWHTFNRAVETLPYAEELIKYAL